MIKKGNFVIKCHLCGEEMFFSSEELEDAYDKNFIGVYKFWPAEESEENTQTKESWAFCLECSQRVANMINKIKEK